MIEVYKHFFGQCKDVLKEFGKSLGTLLVMTMLILLFPVAFLIRTYFIIEVRIKNKIRKRKEQKTIDKTSVV